MQDVLSPCRRHRSRREATPQLKQGQAAVMVVRLRLLKLLFSSMRRSHWLTQMNHNA
jgi:hypothetical protein